jgi:hypothetical protein
MVDFTDDPGMKSIAEYLFTVNTAKSIRGLNGPAGDPFKIYLEKSTRDVARDSLRLFKSIPGTQL